MKKIINVAETLQSAKRLKSGWKETIITLAEGEVLVHDQLRIKGPGKVWVGEAPNGVIKCGTRHHYYGKEMEGKERYLP